MALRGLQVAQGFRRYSVLAGTIIPAVLLIGFAVVFLVSGNQPAMEVSAEAFLLPSLPRTSPSSPALLMFSGIEIAAIPQVTCAIPAARFAREPDRRHLCFMVFAPLTLAIATVIPAGEINIVAGLGAVRAKRCSTNSGPDWLTYVPFTFLLVTVDGVTHPDPGWSIARPAGGRQGRWGIYRLCSSGRTRLTCRWRSILAQAAVSLVLALATACWGRCRMFGSSSIIQTNMTRMVHPDPPALRHKRP